MRQCGRILEAGYQNTGEIVHVGHQEICLKILADIIYAKGDNMNFNNKDKNRIELNRDAKVQQKKKNGKWFNTITTSLRFLRIQREEETSQIGKRKFSGKIAKLAKGTIAAGFAVGGAAAANGMNVYASEADPAQQEIQQEAASSNEDVEVIVEEKEVEVAAPAETNTAGTSNQEEQVAASAESSPDVSAESSGAAQTNSGTEADAEETAEEGQIGAEKIQSSEEKPDGEAAEDKQDESESLSAAESQSLADSQSMGDSLSKSAEETAEEGQIGAEKIQSSEEKPDGEAAEGKQDESESLSAAESQSLADSQSIVDSLTKSTEASLSASESESERAASETASQSLAASESESTSLVEASLSMSHSMEMSKAHSVSESFSQVESLAHSESESISTSESLSADYASYVASRSIEDSQSLSASASVSLSLRIVQSESESLSIATSTSASEAAAVSDWNTVTASELASIFRSAIANQNVTSSFLENIRNTAKTLRGREYRQSSEYTNLSNIITWTDYILNNQASGSNTTTGSAMTYAQKSNGEAVDSNKLGFDLTDDAVKSRGTSNFLQVNKESTTQTSMDLRVKYANAIVKTNTTSVRNFPDIRMSGKGASLSDTVYLYKLDSNNNIAASKALTLQSTELEDGARYFVPYVYKWEASDGFHLDGFIYAYNAEENTFVPDYDGE